MKPREKTPDELRDELMEHVRHMIKYWAELPDFDNATGRHMTLHDRCEGVAHSIFATLDGCTLVTPAFDLVARPHEEDKNFHIEQGENWIKPGTTISDALRYHVSKGK